MKIKVKIEVKAVENQGKQNILGIVAEYNPFHNGHLYHLKESIKKCNAKYVVAIISGNFTQRGDTSIVNKFDKAKMAIKNGVDMVIELPTLYSISSAENFANGSIKIFNDLGVITHISFGSELGDIEQLNDISSILTDEPYELKKILKEELKKGNSFPVARQKAIIKYTNNSKYEEILNSPNNILAIEYLKALKKTKSKIIPITIERKNVNYNSDKIIQNFASSTLIRQEITKNLNCTNNINNINNIIENIPILSCLPTDSLNIIKENIENGKCIPSLKYFEDMIVYKLRSMNVNEIKNLPDTSEGLENIIKKAANETNNLEDLINICKSKRYTRTRIQRILIYALLGITKQDMEMSRKINPYIRILGINSNGRKLLSIINKKNIVTSVKKFENSNEDKDLKRMMEIDKLATNIYSIKQKKDYCSGLDYKNPVILN